MLHNSTKFLRRHTTPFKFLIIGSTNTIIDLSLFMIFANFMSIYPVYSSILSTGITLMVSFFLNHHFVFKSQKKRRTTLIAFVGTTLFNVWIIQSTVIFIAYHSLENIVYFDDHIWTLNLVSKLCGVSVSTILNYLSYRKIFKGEVPDDKKQED
ncbi:MAG: GtrA family protein [Bacteroidia bacterium]|nr:GtrA family protein [Bacteroidia bacterium]